jgi:hypothetical protein
MSNHEASPESASQAASPEIRQEGSTEAVSGEASQNAAPKSGRRRYSDMQSAARFPLKLPVSVKSKSGARQAETTNISANGVLFQVVDAEMPVGSMVDFTISLPADVVGATADVRLDCRGRVVRSFEEDGRRGVGVVIDEYRFERR